MGNDHTGSGHSQYHAHRADGESAHLSETQAYQSLGSTREGKSSASTLMLNASCSPVSVPLCCACLSDVADLPNMQFFVSFAANDNSTAPQRNAYDRQFAQIDLAEFFKVQQPSEQL